MADYQTLSEFLLNPFRTGNSADKDATYAQKYSLYVGSNQIKLMAICEIGDSFYYHLKVPSESQKSNNYNYDVIIRFFPEDSSALENDHLRNYKIQFFSNSPSFMYKYAYLYKQQGYLIELLYDKLDADYIDIPPEKSNSKMEISYDKSIYFACRFLSENKYKYLAKNGMNNLKKIDRTKFFSQISDFRSIKLDQAIMSEESKLKKNLIQKEKSSKPRNTNTNANKGITSITIAPIKKGKPKITGVKKITGKKKK